jgi:hypothetical protein
MAAHSTGEENMEKIMPVKRLGYYAGWLFSLGTPVSSTNKTDCHEISEILLKVALNTIILTLTLLLPKN